MSMRFGKRNQRKSRMFNPSHSDLDKAINQFLTSGGEIRKVCASDYSSQQFILKTDRESAADDFLNDAYRNSASFNSSFCVPDVLS